MGLAWDLVGFQDILKKVIELKKACLELETAHDVDKDLQEFCTSSPVHKAAVHEEAGSCDPLEGFHDCGHKQE